jgi:hypothetical protein
MFRDGAELHPVRNSSRQPSAPVAEVLIRKILSGANTADFLLPVVMFIRTQCAERRCNTTRGRAHEQLDDGADRHLPSTTHRRETAIGSLRRSPASPAIATFEAYDFWTRQPILALRYPVLTSLPCAASTECCCAQCFISNRRAGSGFRGACKACQPNLMRKVGAGV